MLQRADLRDTLFIAMSNYYYDEKKAYLESLAEVRARDHDLTLFLLFGLRGIAIQCQRLFTEIRNHVSKALFLNLMQELSVRLRTKRKRVIASRQNEVLSLLLDAGVVDLGEFVRRADPIYRALKNPRKAMVRDLDYLIELGAVEIKQIGKDRWTLEARLEWPTEITETEFFNRVKQFPRAKSSLPPLP